jgi:hypothetical protein
VAPSGHVSCAQHFKPEWDRCSLPIAAAMREILYCDVWKVVCNVDPLMSNSDRLRGQLLFDDKLIVNIRGRAKKRTSVSRNVVVVYYDCSAFGSISSGISFHCAEGPLPFIIKTQFVSH